ncbi:hypothetical protein [Butyrivibrio sp. JL13D10]|uniref:hypothetical protein n=1 Tax=Butyrivibrio sp. JL13D10 TaxID=3236815 RepID=UPI0038B47AA3
MENKRKSLSHNSIITGLMVTAYAVIMGLLYTYYYDLNDDVLMKDILSGVFAGSPKGHNIQMLYPVSLLISIFYRAFRQADCYGIYLILCQYISFYILVKFTSDIIGNTILGRFSEKKFRGKEVLVSAFSNLFVIIVCTAFIPGHLLIVQYTFAVAMMCSAAAVLFFEKRDMAGAAVLILAFGTRSEMTLLMLPFVLLVLFYRFVDEKQFKRDALACALIIGGLLISEGLNLAGYSTPEWKEFTSFFNSRTDIYDFYQIPDYDENKDFYDSIEMKKSEYELLVNYNFGLDDSIDAAKMAQIAEYAKSIRKEEGLIAAVKRSISPYFYRLRQVGLPKSYEYPMTDAPWNAFLMLMYFVAFVVTMADRSEERDFKRRVFLSLWKLIILFAGRTLIWMYIMVRGRDPIRITHSLYLIETVVLLLISGGCLEKIVEKARHGKRDADDEYSGMHFHIFAGFCLVTVIAICAVNIPAQLHVLGKECKGRAEYNRAYEELDRYCRDNPDKLFLLDVYTSVSYEDNGFTYSQKMLTDVDNSLSNQVLMGGWASKSPVEKEKLQNLGYTESMEDIALDENVLIVADKDTEMEWLKLYYKDKDRDVRLENTDLIAGEFVIWKVSEAK